MSGHFRFFTLLALGLPVLTTGCGGGGSSHSAPAQIVAPAAATTIAASVSALALSVNDTALNPALTGAARTITITNAGSNDAVAIHYGLAALPPGTAATSTCTDGASLAPGASCTLTIIPGATASATPGATAPQSATLDVSGVNTNTLTVAIDVLTYGSVYQGGYLFAVDDTTPAGGSIGGKVAALTDVPSPSVWDGMPVAVGVDELSTTPCDGSSDGACNTRRLMDVSPFSVAYLCVSSTAGGYSDWYLPAICEMGYDSASWGSGCGSAVNPATQNMQSSLVDYAAVDGAPDGDYWSSTEYSANPSSLAIKQFFGVGGGYQNGAAKSLAFKLRCARALH